MKRRDFLRMGTVAVGTPATLSLLNLACTRAEPSAEEAAAAGASGQSAGAAASGADDRAIRISANENALGVPESVRDAVVRGFDRAHEYPGSSAGQLREAVAARHGVAPESVLLGHGSTDVLRMAVQAEVARRPDLRLVQADPTFEQPARYGRPYGVEVVRAPLLEGSYAHDLDAMRAAADAARAEGRGALVYLCNPNNPTGTLTSVADVRAWIEEAPAEHFFLVDEAYFEFVEDPAYETLDRWAVTRPNVLVTRTFSKVYAMAGIRIGYGLGHPDTIDRLDGFSVATSPNHLGNVAGLAALEDEDFLRRSLEVNRDSRAIAYRALDDLEIPYMPSHTNFVMHRIRGDLETYRDRMREEGLLVGRAFPPYTDHNRVSLGTAEQMERWAEALRSFRERGWV